MKKIKILHFYSRMNAGGAETFIMNVYRKINKNKYHFDFLCSSNEKAFYDKEIKELGGNIYYYKVSKNPLKTIKNIRKTLKENGPYDCIHSPLMFYSSIICIAAKLEGIKNIIVHSHSAGDKKKQTISRKIYTSISRIIINKLSTKKLACGKAAGDFLFGKNQKYEVLYNGIQLDKFNNISEKEIKEIKDKYNLKKEIIIGEVARFYKEKNHNYFINLAKKLNIENINYKIFLVGDGELKEEFEKKIEEEGLKDNFILLGSTYDVGKYMATFDIFMMPSLYEGFPLTVIEALATGTPCLLSNTITKEIKMFGNYIEFFDINKNIDTNLIKKKKITKEDKSKINQLIITNKFDIESTTIRLEKIYKN